MNTTDFYNIEKKFDRTKQTDKRKIYYGNSRFYFIARYNLYGG